MLAKLPKKVVDNAVAQATASGSDDICNAVTEKLKMRKDIQAFMLRMAQSKANKS